MAHGVYDRSVDVFGTQATAVCDSPDHYVIGGGGSCDNGALRGSRPGSGGWEITCQSAGLNRVSIICALK